MLGKIVLSAGLLAGGLISFNGLMNVTETDIAVHHEFERSAASKPLRPGDVVALSSENREMEAMCSLQLGTDRLRSDPLTYMYFNSLRQTLPDFVTVLLIAKDSTSGKVGEPSALSELSDDGIPFVGWISGVRRISSAPDLPSDCECEMARRLAAGEAVCTVNEALIRLTQRPFENPDNPSPTAGGYSSRTIAVTLAKRSNRVGDEKFASCGVEKTELAVATMNRDCRVGNMAPVDARVRHWLNVIDKREMQVQSAALSE